MSFWRKYVWAALVSARSNLAYFSEVASRLVFLAVILFIFLKLWQVAYAETKSVMLGGLTLPEMLWYLTIAEAIMMSAPRVTQAVDEDVRTGALAVQLVKPISYPLYRLSVTLGERLVRFVLSLLAGGVIALVLVGPIHLEAAGLGLFALVLPAAFLVDFLGNFLIGLGAFWLEDTNGLMLIYSRVTMILGGMMIPLDLLPDGVANVLKALPWSGVVYGPALMFVHPSAASFLTLIVRQGLSIAGFALAVYAVYALALKRVHAHGG